MAEKVYFIESSMPLMDKKSGKEFSLLYGHEVPEGYFDEKQIKEFISRGVFTTKRPIVQTVTGSSVNESLESRIKELDLEIEALKKQIAESGIEELKSENEALKKQIAEQKPVDKK